MSTTGTQPSRRPRAAVIYTNLDLMTNSILIFQRGGRELSRNVGTSTNPSRLEYFAGVYARDQERQNRRRIIRTTRPQDDRNKALRLLPGMLEIENGRLDAAEEDGKGGGNDNGGGDNGGSGSHSSSDDGHDGDDEDHGPDGQHNDGNDDNNGNDGFVGEHFGRGGLLPGIEDWLDGAEGPSSLPVASPLEDTGASSGAAAEAIVPSIQGQEDSEHRQAATEVNQTEPVTQREIYMMDAYRYRGG